VIVILNGPLGVGKTETAWKLIEYFERAAILDCDYVGGNVSTFDHQDPNSFRSTISCIVALAKHQKVTMGITDFVVSGVFENSEQLSIAKSLLSEISDPVKTYLLLTKPDILKNRVQKRMNDNVERETARAYELSRILQTAIGDLGKAFDTSNLTIKEIAEKIWKDIQLSQ
jgi:hypothetical protein